MPSASTSSEPEGADSWHSLLASPGYLRYFCAVALARASGTMFNVAVVLLVLQRTGSLSLAGFTAAAGSFPAAITGPVLGAWLDVARSRRVLIVLDQVTSIVTLAGILALTGHAPNWTVPALAVLYGVTRPLSGGAFSSVLPEVVSPRLLPRANTMEATSINLAFIVGPALAGLVAGAAGAAIAVEVEIALTAITAVLVAGDPTFELRPRTRVTEIRKSIAGGLRAIVTILPLRAGTAAALLSTVAWGSLVVSYPAYAVSLDAGPHSAGYLWAAISLGSVVSAFAFVGLPRRMSTIALLAGSLAAMGASAALWPLAHSLPVALALVALTGMLEGPALGVFFSVRQRFTPPQLRGQVFTTVASLNLAGIAAGAALAGPIQNSFGTTAVLLMFTVLQLAAAAAMLTARVPLGYPPPPP